MEGFTRLRAESPNRHCELCAQDMRKRCAGRRNKRRSIRDRYLYCVSAAALHRVHAGAESGRLIGVLYLENNLATGAFTDDRIKVMQLISAEAAISLENARLYEEMKQEVTRRRQAEEELRVAWLRWSRSRTACRPKTSTCRRKSVLSITSRRWWQ